MRDTVTGALTLEMLGELVRTMSEAISELDGAGSAGVLSPIQARQVAMLIYDSTVDVIVSRFAGNVSRFKLGMAVALIVVAKGRVHAQAIGRTMRERRRVIPATYSEPPAPLPTVDELEPEAVDEPAAPPAPVVPPTIGNDLGRGIAE